MSINAWTENTSKQFQDYIVGFLKVTPSLYRYMESNGLIRNLGDGVDKIQYLEALPIDGGRMGSSIHQHNIVTPNWKEMTVSFLYNNSLIRLSKQMVDKYKRGNWLNGDLIQDTIRMVMPTVLNQIDQFCAWGTLMKDSLPALDIYRGTTTFTGLFNSGTTITGGRGNDDDMTALGDFRYTVGKLRKALRSAAHEMKNYKIFSDLETQHVADTATEHEYANVGVSEYQRVLEKSYIGPDGWIDSLNFIDVSETKHRIVMCAPKQIDPKPIGGKGITNNFELIQGYPFRVYPLYGGEPDVDKFFNWAVSWSGAFVVYKDTAIQHTGDLDITP